MARIHVLLLTAFSISGFCLAFLKTTPRGLPSLTSNDFHHQSIPLSLWLPAAGSPLQQFTFSTTGTPKQHAEKASNKVNGSGVNRTQPQFEHNVTNRGNNTSLSVKNNLTKSSHHGQQSESSQLFGQHFHYPNLFHHGNNSSMNNAANATISSKNQTSITSYYGSLLETYFPFLQQPSNKTALKLPSTKYAKKSNTDASLELLNAMTVLQDRKDNDTVTISDLRSILAQAAASSTNKQSSTPYPGVKIGSTSNIKGAALSSQELSSSKRPTSQVAFPQPSILSYRDVQRGTTFAGGFLGLILGTTILPNLWLVGMSLGAVYGYEITKEPVITDPTTPPKEPNMIAKRLISLGRKLAQTFLQAYDHWKTLWFLYKTGQLSYEYYKRYEMLDQKFEIQTKVDAWNRRFAEGKKKFDAWEEENEVGRTILAGLRTVWLVDEQSKRRAREKSRYRLVQVLYDAKFYVKLYLRKLKLWANSFFREGGLQGVIANLKEDLNSGDSASARVGAALVAVMVVNFGGAMFSISPVFTNLLAVVAAVLWPSGALDLFTRIRNPASERLARRRDNNDSNNNPMAMAPDFMRRYDRKRYHFFERSDGTKRYYRTGQSMAASRKSRKEKGSTSFNNFFWQPKPVLKEKKAWWDIRYKPTGR